MVVACLEELLPVITHILNSSLALGHFPSKWKDALVDPRLKTGKDTSFPNLRPVSNLQYISKLTERAVYDQTHSHMSQYELYPLLQSAYRAGHSTETALLKVQNDILLNMDRKRVTLLVLLDLSAAFDTVDHQVLVRRLETSFGITGTALSWFSSYLSQRSQRICYEGCISKTFDLHHGVPQGSCLGPLLFTVYASKLFEVIKFHLPDAHAYADDTQLYLSFQADSEADQAEAVSAMERCIANISNWMKLDKLKLNSDKTEIILIGTKPQLSKIKFDHIKVGHVDLSVETAAVRNLGAWFDRNLSMSTHINKICQSVYYHLHNIRQIRKYLTQDSAKLLVQAVIMARIDYCNGLLYNVPAVHLSKLQRLQNTAARLITLTPKFDHISPVLFKLHWLPVKYRIQYKIGLLTFKAIHFKTPQYLSNLLSIKGNNRFSLRSASNGLILDDPTCRYKVTLGDRSFRASAPKTWNALPKGIRDQTNIITFKTMLKTHLFRIAYSNFL